MDTVIGDCDSASSREDERMQRCRRYAIRTVLSAVAEAGISDNSSYAPRSSGAVPGQAPSRD
jgi:3-oxoacyl-(acyl-carrier-protein) synthase